MQCPQCQHENRDTARFCEACGSKLALSCPSCGNLTRPGASFCDHCGSLLTGPTSVSRPTQIDSRRGEQEEDKTPSRSLLAGREVPEAERRQLTMMFCDLVGSTPLSEQLDPEELREVLRIYQKFCAEVIRRFEGYIAQYLGDGILVYFGYPLAHEDDAQRAIRAGLKMVAELPHLNAQLRQAVGAFHTLSLQVRIGIHTGLVVVGMLGEDASHEHMALGETPNIAARLQGVAEPDTVVISAATYRLVRGFFACQNLGFHSLKGISQPMTVYRVLHESDVQSRLEVAAPSELTPLVGREQEVGLLLERWEQVKDGMGQVVLLSGEAGIGKSRIVKVLKEYVSRELHSQSEIHCSPYYQNSALYPIIDLLQRALQFQREDSPEEKLRKLEEMLGQYNLSLPEVVPLFASLLSVPLGERYSSLHLSPQQQKQKTLEALLALRLAIAAQQPVLYIVEDLHWADPSTLEWLSLLLDQVPASQIFVLLTFRPEFHPPWVSRSYLTPITLSRLSRTQVETMVKQITGSKALPFEIHQQLVTKTDGIPLFVEELTKMVLESDLLREEGDHYALMGPLPLLAIPATLHDSLMARLDRLTTPVKAVAQLGATLGRAFSYELLQAVSLLNEVTLQHSLAQLVEAELLYQRGLPPQATYIFKHALIQEAAYQSLLKSIRQQYHQQIAQVLVEKFPETVETQPELLAHHYTEAGLSRQAIDYWQRAGQRALKHSANVEAVNHLAKGLELLTTLPDTAERIQQELNLQITLGPALIATRGYAAPEVRHTYARAQELCQQVGETPQLFPVLRGLWIFYVVRGELQTARELGEQILTLAQRQQDPALLVEANRVLGTTLFYLGELASALEHLEQGIALYDPQQHRSHAFLYGQDPAMACLSFAAWALCLLGYPDQALKRSQEALTLAQELSHPFSLVHTLVFAAGLHGYRREAQVVRERAESAITLSIEQGFTFWVAMGNIRRGWALAEQEQREEGILQMRQGQAAYQATGAEISRPSNLAMLAEAYMKGGQVREGLNVIAEALTAAHKTGERYYEAELHRLKGEFLLRQAVPAEQQAETCFHQALDVASRQGAKLLELRAVMSLGRLWQHQGKYGASHQILAEIYSWFTEGFDTVDLKEAKTLLEVLQN